MIVLTLVLTLTLAFVLTLVLVLITPKSDDPIIPNFLSISNAAPTRWGYASKIVLVLCPLLSLIIITTIIMTW